MRRKPTRLKQIEGTLRRDRVNAREPKPPKTGAIMPRRSSHADSMVQAMR